MSACVRAREARVFAVDAAGFERNAYAYARSVLLPLEPFPTLARRVRASDTTLKCDARDRAYEVCSNSVRGCSDVFVRRAATAQRVRDACACGSRRTDHATARRSERRWLGRHAYDHDAGRSGRDEPRSRCDDARCQARHDSNHACGPEQWRRSSHADCRSGAADDTARDCWHWRADHAAACRQRERGLDLDGLRRRLDL